MAAALQEAFPDFNSGWTVRVFPIEQEVVGDVQRPLWVLLGAVGLLLMSAFGGPVLESLLYEISPSDTVTLAGAASVLATASLLACAIPAWRASRVAPSQALRSE